jgi:hypothetical protein
MCSGRHDRIVHKDEYKYITNDTSFISLFIFYIICSFNSTHKIIKIHKFILNDIPYWFIL